MAWVLCCGTIRQSKWLSFIPWRTFFQRRRNSSADQALGMDAGVRARFVGAWSVAAPLCGGRLQAGSAVPASVTATPDDAPSNRSLRDNPSETLLVEDGLLIYA